MKVLKTFSAAIIMFMLLSVASWADIIYTTSDGVLGSIVIISSSDIVEPSIEYRSGIDEPYLSAYWNGNGTNVMLIDPYKTESGDRAYIFSPTSLASPSESRDIAGVYGTYLSGYANNGRSLFMAAGSKIFEVKTSDFAVVNSYDCRKILSSDGNDTEIVSVLVDNDYVHVIVGSDNARKFVRFDGQLKDNVKYFISADVSADASCLFKLSNTVLMGCQPGIMSLGSNGKFVQYISSDATVVSMCEDDEERFYYAMKESSDQTYTFTVTNIQNSSLRTKFARREILSNYPYIKMMRDRDKNVLAIMTGEGISFFDIQSGRNLRNFTASELGGRPFGMVMSSVSGYDSSSSSGGCQASGAGVLVLAMAVTLWKKKIL